MKHLIARWLREAGRHEQAADDLDDDDDERVLHLEIALVYRQCAGELFEHQQVYS